MAKKKKSKTLFEVIAQDKQQQGKANLGIPGWAKKPATSTEPLVQPAPGEAARPPAPPQEEAPGPVSAWPEDVTAAAAEQPTLSTAGGRLRLSLNYASCTVALVGLVLLLIVVFVLGRASVRSATAPGAGGSSALSGAGDPSAPRAPPRIPGKYYLVIQAMGGLSSPLRADAEGIAEYCTDVGEPAEVGRISGEYVVLSLVGFDSKQSPEAKDYAARIHELGQRYQSQEKKEYAFRQRDEKVRLKPRWYREPPHRSSP